MTAPLADERAASGLMRGGLALLVCALLAFTLWQYAMPPSFASSFGSNPGGVVVFGRALGIPRFAVSDGAYRWGFRGLLVAAWAGYLLLVLAGLAGGRLPRRLVAVVGALLASILCVVWPTTQSVDTYAYVGFGRLSVVYGLNPYVTPQNELIRLHDVTAPFVGWGSSSPFAPL